MFSVKRTLQLKFFYSACIRLHVVFVYSIIGFPIDIGQHEIFP